MTTPLDTVKAVVARTFSVDQKSLSDVTVAADVDGWDSVSHTTLILKLEDAFGRQLPFDALYNAENLGKLADAIEESV